MQKGPADYWRRLGRIERAFLILVVLYGVLFWSAVSPIWQSIIGIVAFLTGVMVAFRVARRAMKKAIWRLRNRLIVAYLFIAVVPIVLITALLGLAGYAVIEQVSIYQIGR